MIAVTDRLPLEEPGLTLLSECPTCWEFLPADHVCRCECGVPLDEHPELPKPRAWGRRDKTDVSRQRAGGRRAASQQPNIWRKRGRPIRLKRERRIDDDR